MILERETTIPVGGLRPFRCPRCNALLAKLRLTPGSVVEIKCGRCSTLVKEAA